MDRSQSKAENCFGQHGQIHGPNHNRVRIQPEAVKLTGFFNGQ